MDFKRIHKIIYNVCNRKKGNTIFSIFNSSINPNIYITALFTPLSLTQVHVWNNDECVGYSMIHQRKLYNFIKSYYWSPLIITIILEHSNHYTYISPSEILKYNTLTDPFSPQYNYIIWSYKRDGMENINTQIGAVYKITKFLKNLHYYKLKKIQKRINHELSLLPSCKSSGFPGGCIYRTAMSEFEASANEMKLY